MNYHEYNRTTGDLDVWLKPDNENKKSILRCLEKYDLEIESLQQINELDFSHALVFSLGDEPYKTDFLTKVSGVNYTEADKEKVHFNHDGIMVPFINLNHLILSKMSTGRGKDKVDVEKLQEVEAKRKKQ